MISRIIQNELDDILSQSGLQNIKATDRKIRFSDSISALLFTVLSRHHQPV